MIETIGASFLLVFLAEMGDKTQLLAFSLAARFRKPIPILAGIFVATIANHALAAAAGSWIATHVAAKWLGLGLGAGFLAFAVWTLIPDRLEENREPAGARGAFLTTTGLFFLAEMGDKTQLATAALAARFGSILLVVAGTTLGMMLADGLAVFFGARVATVANPAVLRRIAAGLFAVTGIWSMYESIR